MLAPRVRQVTTSTGTGNLTLAASTGQRAFHDVFGTGTFYYVLNDLTNAAFEAGIGRMSDSTTFVRGIITSNSDGTETALDLGAGDKVLTCAIPGELAHGYLWSAQAETTVAGYVYRTWIRDGLGAPRGVGGSLSVSMQDTVNYTPTVVNQTIRVTGLGLVGTGGGNAVIGIYSMTDDGLPYKRLASTAEIAAGNNPSVYTVSEFASPITLPAGWYFIAYTAESGALPTGWTGSLMAVTVDGTYAAWSESRTYDSTLPATAGSVSGVTDGAAVWLIGEGS